MTIRNRIRRLAAPGYSWCRHCGESWKTANPHAVMYAPGRVAFAVCEKCWPTITPAQRVEHMRARHAHHDYWPEIEIATLREGVMTQRQVFMEEIITIFDLPRWQADILRQQAQFNSHAGLVGRLFTTNPDCLTRDAHRVAGIADEELRAWDEFLESVKTTPRPTRSVGR